jgi:superfamily II DNA or RNA helicase
VFGKVIHFNKNSSTTTESSNLPSEITNQFKNEILAKGLQIAESSRISHINFGREAYFALVTDSTGKPVYVHLILDPTTKLLSRATCGCFRSSTRTYCHHIVSLVRYILRPDPVTGKLRSLCDDFQDSFWYEISWFGYKNYGDSILGFRAQVNHGDEGLRIVFMDKSAKEVLAFMPGACLVDEYLYDFFEVINRDIDPAVFKAMYGRKLKDSHVPSQRRRPWGYTTAEEEINRKGMKSNRQQYEDSMWHRIAKVAFLVSGRQSQNFHFKFLEHKEGLIVEGFDEEGSTILRFVPPRTAIGAIIELGEKKGVIGEELPLQTRSLKTGYRIDLEEDSSLCITPIVENPDPNAEADEQYLCRIDLEHQLYGSYYYFPQWGFFRIEVPGTSGLPAEYFSPQKIIRVPPDQITAFLEQHGDLLRNEPGILVDDALLQRKTVENYRVVTADHKSVTQDGITLNITYEFGDFSLTLRDIYEAKKYGKKFLIRGDKWVDTGSAEFSWVDALDEGAVSSNNTLVLGRREYLRFVALHERLEKKFSTAKLKEWFTSLERLKPPKRPPALADMKGTLRGYQKTGYGWLWFLYENGFSGLLCDDMGLGKTHQVMALMTGILRRKKDASPQPKFLVICPTSVLSHWKDKVNEYCPLLNPYVYHGTDRIFHEAFQEHTLIITSYGIALRDIEILADFRFELLVLDEIQAVKNKATKTYAAVKALEASCTLGLTGTPIENSVSDLKSLFDIILPGYLLSDSQFEKFFRYPIDEGAEDAVAREKLARLISPFVLRRKKEQVLKELPEKIEDVRRCSLSGDQLKFYRDLVNNQGQELVQKLKDPDEKVPYMHIFALLNYLKQVCDHPALLEGERTNYKKYSSGKWDLFIELLEESLGSGQKVVVFSQYVKMLELIESYLTDNGIEFATIKGHTRRRAEAVTRFNTDPRCMVFSASLRASGLGIDLTGASVVIHYDRWWNSAREDQATDRVHRIGQKRGVQVFKLVTEDTLEEKIDKIISKKKELMNSIVRHDDKGVLKYFTREDLIELMSI